jgi:hypothetical protein
MTVSPAASEPPVKPMPAGRLNASTYDAFGLIWLRNIYVY